MKAHILITIFWAVTSCTLVESVSFIFWVVDSSTLKKKKTVGLPETLITIYQNTHRHAQEDEDLCIYRHKTSNFAGTYVHLPGIEYLIFGRPFLIDIEADILKHIRFHSCVQLIPLSV